MKYILLVLLVSSCLIGFAQPQPPVLPDAHLKKDPIDRISTQLEALGTSGEFSGVVAIEKEGKLVLEKAYGYAHIGYQIPNAPETRFAFGSMGKMFTGIAIMQQVEKGTLDLEATVGTYLPTYPTAMVRDWVTLHHLLTHTSGLPDFMTDEYLSASKHQFRTVADFLPYFENEPLEFTPGSRYEYRNSDYILLGLILEAVTGETYYDYVNTHILAPAGMQETGFPDWDHPTPHRATGYTASSTHPGELMANTYLVPAMGGPFGGGCGTARDFLAFARTLQQHTLLSPELTTLAFKGKAADSTYGYGFVNHTQNGHQMIGHSGGHFGIAGELNMFTDLGYSVVILTNRDVQNGFLQARYLIQTELIGKTPGSERYAYTKSLVNLLRKEGESAALSNLAESDILPSGIMLNRAGFQALDSKDYPLAKSFFTVYQTAYPASADAQDCMGEAFFLEGKYAKAKESFEKALELDAEDAYALRRLGEIGERE